MPSAIPHPRTIKSFTIREGRLTSNQRHALETEWARYVLSTENLITDWADIFPDIKKSPPTPIILEIGFGMGHALLKNSHTHPDTCFIGIEVYRPGIGTLLAELKTQQINNVRIFYGDAVEILKRCVPDQSLDAIQIFFPDPWPKRRHHKRRLIQLPFVALITKKLKIGGKLHLATDWEDYANHMSQVLSLADALTEVPDSPDKQNRPLTKYERRGQTLGHQVWDLVFCKKS